MTTTHSSQKGVALIEILVSSFLISIGLFGLAKLQISAVKSANDGYLYSQAALLGEEMGERMRANPTALVSYVAPLKKAHKAKKNCHKAKCLAPEIADQDLEDWSSNVDSTLPDSAASVERAAGAGKSSYNITVRWRGYSEGNCDANAKPGSEFWCFTVTVQES